ncbi:hypothetical protein F4778DRAFT_587055 [Xylariomycetidae sp. FL2044]|nr:hypothetical protein F4778DRAFT_587055 [Xylariomycetidae sp. FL2044]
MSFELSQICRVSCLLDINGPCHPSSSLCVHSSCMMFGGSFDSAYTITIHTLPDLIQPSLNKRNAALIQRHLQESLGVVAARGYVHFVACPAENVAIAGKTIAADMGDVNQVRRNEKTGGSAKTSKIGRKLSAKSLKNFRSSSTLNLADRVAAPAPHHSGETTRIATIPEVPATAAEDEKPGECAQRGPSRTPSLRKTLRILGILPQRAGEGRSRTPGPDR